jgi:quercetin dioxygenase-like cupin family protein
MSTSLTVREPVASDCTGGALVEDRLDRHCVIGAGMAGLAAAKVFQERGIRYDQLEANDELGGNWYDGVYDSTHIISSRDTTAFPGFPMPRDWPDFISKDQMLAYLKAVADECGLRQRIEFETRVSRVEPLGPNGLSGWRVTLAGGERRDYQGVVAANGHFWAKHVPQFPGRFSGKTLHSKDYKRPSDLDGSRVLVVGSGNSAGDIAVEAARAGFETWIAIRRGRYIFPETLFGVPIDQIERWYLPLALQRIIAKALLRIAVGPYERYGLPKPVDDIFDRDVAVNSQLLYSLRRGELTSKPGICRLDGHTVHFVDGAALDVDTIVWCTGFELSLPFLDREMFDWAENGYPKLSGFMPPGIANLYVFGLGQPRGGAGILITLAARLLASMVSAQRDLDHPLSSDLARVREPEARKLFGVAEGIRQLKLGERAVKRIHRRARPQRRPGHSDVLAVDGQRAADAICAADVNGAPVAYRRLDNPSLSESYQFLETGRETNGEWSKVRWTALPGCRQPAHRHPNQEDAYLIEEGELEFRIAGKKRVVRAGDSLVIPPGVPHSVRNRTGRAAVALVQKTPALDAKPFYESVSGLAREGRTICRGIPRNPLQMAVFAEDFKDDFRLAFPPFAIQRLVNVPLAALGRRLGYRRTYDRYAAETESV